MATVQDYLNLSLSLTVGNKAGTDNQVYLPNDLRKFENLKVDQFRVETIKVSAGASSTLTRDNTSESFFIVLFDHPVRVTAINGSSIADSMYTSFLAFGRNSGGTASFNASVVAYTNDLASPAFVTEDAGSATTVNGLVLQFELDA